MPFIAVYITHPDMREAKRVVSHLIKKRLIACANMYPVDSTYWWRGRIESAKEVVSLVKCRSENWTKLKKEVETVHKYDTPCIMRLTASANRRYEKWVKAESRTKRTCTKT